MPAKIINRLRIFTKNHILGNIIKKKETKPRIILRAKYYKKYYTVNISLYFSYYILFMFCISCNFVVLNSL